MKLAKLNEYRNEILLDEPLKFPKSFEYLNLNENSLKKIVGFLLDILRKQDPRNFNKNHESYADMREELYIRLISRNPLPLPGKFYENLDKLFQYENSQKEIFDSSLVFQNADISKKVLWQGDITKLKVDAIVNAANEQMLGCFIPFHRCIDNAIHAVAGPRLREDCYKIMKIQQSYEPTGYAKITRGHNVPASFVLHTVGPIFSGSKMDYQNNIVSAVQQSELVSCYNQCLEVASKIQSIKSIAFCSISTGIFGFPKEKAAELAVKTVNNWIKNNQGRLDGIIFNVFSDEDKQIYLKYMPPNEDVVIINEEYNRSE